jgi:predicted phosphodiesterase
LLSRISSFVEGRILPTTPEEELEQALAGTQGDLLVGGHTHAQMFRRFKDLLVFNPGSVGLAMDRVSPLSEIRQPARAVLAQKPICFFLRR